MVEDKKNMEQDFPENVNPDNMTDNQSEVEQNVMLDDNVTDWEGKFNEMQDSFLRLSAEFDNYRKRTLKEKADLLKSGSERVLIDVISLVDDFERALENISSSEDVNAVKEGVDLIYGKFRNFLNKHGVKEINAVGEPFDTDKHEAITSIPAQSDEDKDKVIDCVQKGYTLDDKVIRYPKVVVAK